MILTLEVAVVFLKAAKAELGKLKNCFQFRSWSKSWSRNHGNNNESKKKHRVKIHLLEKKCDFKQQVAHVLLSLIYSETKLLKFKFALV